MPVETEEARTSDAGNGVTTIFDFPYRFLTDDMLLVYLSYIDAGTGENVQIDQVLNTDYTVQGAGADEGGTVTFGTPPPSGNTVTIIRDPDLKQETAYNDGDDFPALSTQDALDKATMQIQRANDRQNRSFELPDTGVSGESFYDVGENRLANVGDGIDDQDAATVKQFNIWTGQVSGDADRAEVAAAEAEGYRDETYIARTEVTTLYLGAKTADPTLDNDGNPLIVGAYYFNTTNNTARTWDGANWQDNAELVDALPLSGGTMTGAIEYPGFISVASAAEPDIGAVAGNLINITGTVTITGFGTANAGVWRKVRFDGVLTLTENATSLILPGGANIITAPGDVADFVSEGSGNWRCAAYSPASGKPIASSSWTLTTIFASNPAWPIPSDASEIWVYAIGAGASGVSSGAWNGGGGGGCELKIYSGIMDATLAITIGAGGPPTVSSAVGSAGGNTTVVGTNIGTVIGLGAPAPVVGGGIGGGGSNGDYTFQGDESGLGAGTGSAIGEGGNAGGPYGGPGATQNGSLPGTQPGGGGSGTGAAGGTSGAGADGGVIILVRR